LAATTGDEIADIAIFRPSTGNWFILTSSSGYATRVVYGFGGVGVIPVPADYDGDHVTDVGIYRPSTGTWFVLTSSSDFTVMEWQGWGAAGDVPVPATDFDADGRADCVVYRPSTGQWFVRPSGGGIPWSVQFGASGDVAVQPVVAPGVPAHPTVYVDYYHLDALTGELGTVLSRHDFLPFGEEWTGAPSRETRLFTGQERDAETGLDYFGARYYHASSGRFTTPDIPGVDQDLTDPQSWNRYGYVRNNPLRFTDPTGLQRQGPQQPPPSPPDFTSKVKGCEQRPWDEVCRARLAEQEQLEAFQAASQRFGLEHQFEFDPTAGDSQINFIARGVAKRAGYLTSPRAYAEWFGFSVAGGAAYAAVLVVGVPVIEPSVINALTNATIRAEILIPGLTANIYELLSTQGPTYTPPTTYLGWLGNEMSLYNLYVLSHPVSR
jgi:RHS repeat-associated protein